MRFSLSLSCASEANVPSRTLLIASVILVSGAVTSTLRAQLPRLQPEPVRILDAVMQYRRFYLTDTTKLDTCQLLETLHRPATFPDRLEASSRAMLDLPVANCDNGRVNPYSPYRPIVRLDSIVIGDSLHRVGLYVQHGEYSHHELYTVAQSLLSWQVVKGEMFGSMQWLPRDP